MKKFRNVNGIVIKDEEYTLSSWVELYLQGFFIDTDRKSQIDCGWFDWFCKDSSLANKTEKLGKYISQIVNSPKFDKDNTYVFFKNCCPCVGGLYDSFRICDCKTGYVLFAFNQLHKGCFGKDFSGWEVYDFTKDAPNIIHGTWKEIKKYLEIA